MNDLEHDLRELFEQRASGVDAPGLAPNDVLRRGRRRQVGTVVTGVLACLVALGVAAAAIGQARHPNVIPGERNGLPARTTSIGGVPVTAPAGWTLVDDYPLAAVLGTSQQTCSFSATGAAVGANGSPVQGSPSPGEGGAAGNGASASGQSCTQESTSLDTSLPFFQLANFSLPLTRTPCKTDLNGPVTVPDDGVAVYVGLFPAGTSRGTLESSCASADLFRYGEVPGTSGAVLAAVAIEGPNATQNDHVVAEDFVDSFEPGNVTLPRPTEGAGPGYVLASGSAGDTAWRLEAGITSLGASGGSPRVGAIMVTTTASRIEARSVDLPTQHVAEDAVDLGNGSVLRFGTAAVDVAAISIDLPSGGAIPAIMFPWSAQGIPDLPNSDDSIWFALAPKRGNVRATYRSAPTGVPTATPVTGELNTKIRSGDGFVVSGHDLGHDWRLDYSGGPRLELFLDGSNEPVGSLPYLIGNETQIDVEGGTFLISLRDPTVTSFEVTTGVTEADQQPSTRIDGGWQRIQDDAGDDGRIWVVPLPGSGTGLEQANADLPSFVSWPAAPPLRIGSMLNTGNDGVVSWALTWQDDHCIILRTDGADPGDSGMSPCLHPATSSKAEVQLVDGATRSTVALAVSHRPPTAITSSDLANGALQCVDIDIESTFAGTTICVFPVADGQRVAIHLDQTGGQPIGPVIVSKDGLSTSVRGSGSATETSSAAAPSG